MEPRLSENAFEPLREAAISVSVLTHPALNVLDDFNREGLGIEVDFSDRRENDLPDRFLILLTPAERVIRSLDPIGGKLIPRINF